MTLAACARALGAALLLWAGAVQAGHISDNRLTQFSGLPGLGRGYNSQRNTLHSVCFESIKAPDPVFDFYYEFDRVDADYLRRLNTENSNWAIDSELMDFVHDHGEPGADSESGPDSGSGSKPPRSQLNIVARITLESYYKTLDESGSPVSKSARTLVEDGRYTAFFNACGFYYVRSLRYSSTFMALIQFTGLGEKEDADFVQLLHSHLFTLGEGGRAAEVEQLALARGLKVFIRGAGLGHASKLENLVPTSLLELRRSITAAAELMQAASSGRITSMEIAPWIEHPDLRSYFFSKDQSGESTFGKTQKLELSSQVITAINQTRNHWLEEYYLASLCRNNLFEYYPVDVKEESAELGAIYDPKRTTFENHRHRGEVDRRITLEQFREYFTRHPPSSFLERANRFLHGTSGRDGADACISALQKEGLDRADFTKIPSCVAAMNSLEIQDRFLRSYCLPTPVTRVTRKKTP